MSIRHAYVATGTNDGAKQVSVDRWNSEHSITAEIDLPMVDAPTPPVANNIALFGQKKAGRMLLAQMGPSGLDNTLQSSLAGSRIGLWQPPGNSTTVPPVIGINALTATGTATARTVATTNFATRMLRLGYVSVATAAGLCGVREAQNKYTTGAGDGLGGFFYRLRFVPSNAAAVAGERMFAGLWSNTAAPTNVEPTTLTNCAGICQLSTSNNLQVYAAGASASAAVDLGANFPANGLSTDAYEFAMFSPAGGGIQWQVWRLGTSFTASGTFASVPTSAVLLGHQIWKTNNATALAVGMDICSIYIETDN